MGKILVSTLFWGARLIRGKHLQKQPPEVFCKKQMFLKISQNSQENTYVRVSFLVRLQALGLQLY